MHDIHVQKHGLMKKQISHDFHDQNRGMRSLQFLSSFACIIVGLNYSPYKNDGK
jgi:hypothetical protein